MLMKNLITIFFIGGGKAGSTTLAMYLKHEPNLNFSEWDKNGYFYDAGKEICWGNQILTKTSFYNNFNSHGNDKACIMLDACPNCITTKRFININHVFPQSKYIMLIRDPVKRLISQFNDDYIIRNYKKTSRTIDDQLIFEVQNNTNLYKLSTYGDILNRMIKILPSKNIIIIFTEDMKNNPQKVIDLIMDTIQIERKKIFPIISNVNNTNEKYKYPSQNVIEILKEKFKKDQILLKNIIKEKNIICSRTF